MSSQEKIIVDTGFIVALFNERDKEHLNAVKKENELGDSCQFVSTIFVIQEVCWLLSNRLGCPQKAIDFLESVQDGFISLPSLPDNWIKKTSEILSKYLDRKLDLTDASIVVLADHLNLGKILTIDRKDFSVLRWCSGKKFFNNLMNDISNS